VSCILKELHNICYLWYCGGVTAQPSYTGYNGYLLLLTLLLLFSLPPRIFVRFCIACHYRGTPALSLWQDILRAKSLVVCLKLLQGTPSGLI